MTYGQKPPHRSGEKEFKEYMKRFPPSLRDTYARIHNAIKKIGGTNIELYHRREGETRYRTKRRPGGQRGRIFAWIKIYNGWLCVFLPEHDPLFYQKNGELIEGLGCSYKENYWYGKGQYEIALDTGDADLEEHISLTVRLLRKAVASAK